MISCSSPNSDAPSPADIARADAFWKPYSVQALVDARAANQPVIIDFFATWCGPCKLLDKGIFQKEAFQKVAGDFVLLRSDMSDREAPEVIRLGRINRIEGLPTIIFLAPDGRERRDLRLAGVISNEKEALKDFLLRMDYAKSNKPSPADPQ